MFRLLLPAKLEVRTCTAPKEDNSGPCNSFLALTGDCFYYISIVFPDKMHTFISTICQLLLIYS